MRQNINAKYKNIVSSKIFSLSLTLSFETFNKVLSLIEIVIHWISSFPRFIPRERVARSWKILRRYFDLWPSASWGGTCALCELFSYITTSVTFVFIQRSLGVVIDRSIARYDKHGENEIVPSWPIASITDHSRSFSLSLPDFYLEISFESLLQIFQRLEFLFMHCDF